MLSSRTLTLILGVAFIILDQWVKLIALVALKDHSYVLGSQPLWLDISLSLNPGAFLSLGAGLAPVLKLLVFVLAVGLVCCWASIWAFKQWQHAPVKACAAWFIAVGGLSNLIDRVSRDGHVVDYLVLNLGPLHTGVFNLADIAIMAGAAVLLVDALTRPGKG
ncbi:MAG: signal peptidase II [Paucimonas sp.]|uniref:signal peptidase II n=1 Tax=Pantoea sp. Cy-639 TaxID=2608360 RepID=UPI00141FF174|nr:signal peptidase II [Pantoea sp. Cy-639]MDR2306960.1 signal peptidase II [Paucimonas sp.]NIF18792.1 signal peptidase II [Pantoea sp. Cy-639]